MKPTTELLQQLKSAARQEIMCREASDTSDAWQDLASPENILALIEIALPVLEERIASSALPNEVFTRLYDQYLNGVICGEGNKSAAKDFLDACVIALCDTKPQPSTNPQIDSDDWIEWKGGDIPTSNLIDVRYRGGDEIHRLRPGNLFWDHIEDEIDIIAYRVVEQERARGGEE